MKILQITLYNLNSLAGKWTIDLTDPNYTSNGIFLICGPTGSGKTTILDAICLALFGETPRLSSFSETQNEIMTKNTAECSAELVFETHQITYRCTWSQHRAYGKEKGKLQDCKHELVNHKTNEIIASSLKDVKNKITTILGMDFKAFTRSMLLAQGEFDNFLHAKESDKASILEQITGTQIYRDISEEAQKRSSEEDRKFKILNDEYESIPALTPEELQQLIKEHDEIKENIKKTQQSYNETTVALEWRKNLNDLENKRNQNLKKQTELHHELETFKPQLQTLEKAQKAALISPEYTELLTLENEQDKDQKTLDEKTRQKPKLEANLQQAINNLNEKKEIRSKIDDESTNTTKLIEKTKNLDNECREIKTERDKEQKNYNDTTKEIQSIEDQVKKSINEKKQVQEKLSNTKEYLNNNINDKWLLTNLSGLEIKIKQLIQHEEERQNVKKEKYDQEIKHQSLISNQESNQIQLQNYKKDLELAKEKEQILTNDLQHILNGQTLQDYEEQKEKLTEQITQREREKSLEQHRQQLKDGLPCPLCGSTSHPYALQNPPSIDELQNQREQIKHIISEANNKIKEEENSKKEIQKITSYISETNLNDTHIKEKIENILQLISQKNEDLKNLNKNIETLQTELNHDLKPLLKTEINLTNHTKLIESLKNRRDQYQNHEKIFNDLQNQSASFDQKLTGLNSSFQEKQRFLQEIKKRLKDKNQQLNKKSHERKTIFQDKDPLKEEKNLKTKLNDAKKQEEIAQNELTKATSNLDSAKNEILTLKKRLEERFPQLSTCKTKFEQALYDQHFQTKDDFLNACLKPEQISHLEPQKDTLDKRQTEISTTIQNLNTDLETQKKRNLSPKSLDELEQQKQQYFDKLQELQNKNAIINNQLEQHTKNNEQKQKQKKLLEAQDLETQKWKSLHKLIGHHKGDTFSKFVQAKCFNILINNANRQLSKITDRYTLISNNNLNLYVKDEYQAGEIRPTTNLSGGETFLVSLALALGLSQSSTKNMTINSLFLDEGFGTLDENTLNAALEALTNLHHIDGKLIGLISHLPALHERITTQIQLIPSRKGTSQISGPACRKLK